MGTFLFDATKLLRPSLRYFVFCILILIFTIARPALAEGSVQVQPAGFYLPGSPTWTGATPAAVCVAHPNFCGWAPGTLISSMTCGIVPGSAVYNASFCISYTEPIVPLSSCPPNSTGTPTATNPTTCTCDAKFQPDAAGTSCVPVSDCKISPLPSLPADDLCAQSLEAGRGADINNACPSLTPEMQNQAQCVSDKIQKLGLRTPYTKPSATIRNAAYQNHLRAVWDKSKAIEKLADSEKHACTAVITDVDSHMARHDFDSPPSSSGNQAPHVNGRAIDIPKSVAKELMKKAAAFITIPKPLNCLPCKDTVTIIGDVQDYMNSTTDNPPACNLRWGGRFTPVDKVHFQLP